MILYALSILILGITIYYAYICYTYVLSIVAEGFIISENLRDTINYYLTTLTPYAFYTIVLFVMAYMVQQIKKFLSLQNIEIKHNELMVDQVVEEIQLLNQLITESQE